MRVGRTLLPSSAVCVYMCEGVCALHAAGPGLLSMSAGDFGEVYAGPQYASCFDAVAACFFLDTA
jgi:hypothetical protein